jgi:uncharacterized RDD family membrane protein YckC
MKRSRFRDVKQGRVSKNLGKKKQDRLIFPTKLERFKAFITDSFMLLMPIMYIVFYLIMGGREGFAQDKLLGWIYIIIPLVMVETIFIAKSGQTPGMKAYEMKVIDLDTKKIPNSVVLIIVRQLLGVFNFLFWGWILMFFRKDHRNLHEILTNTALIKTHS